MRTQISFPYSAEELAAIRITLLEEFAALAGVPVEYISFEVTEAETDAPLPTRRRSGSKQLAPPAAEHALVKGERRDATKGFGKVVEVFITVVIKFVSKVALMLACAWHLSVSL